MCQESTNSHKKFIRTSIFVNVTSELSRNCFHADYSCQFYLNVQIYKSHDLSIFFFNETPRGLFHRRFDRLVYPAILSSCPLSDFSYLDLMNSKLGHVVSIFRINGSDALNIRRWNINRTASCLSVHIGIEH